MLQGTVLPRLIGHQHGFAVAQAVECLHVQADGVGGGAVQRHGRCGVRGCGLNGQRGGVGGSRAGGQRHGGQHQKKAGRWLWREKRCS